MDDGPCKCYQACLLVHRKHQWLFILHPCRRPVCVTAIRICMLNNSSPTRAVINGVSVNLSNHSVTLTVGIAQLFPSQIFDRQRNETHNIVNNDVRWSITQTKVNCPLTSFLTEHQAFKCFVWSLNEAAVYCLTNDYRSNKVCFTESLQNLIFFPHLLCIGLSIHLLSQPESTWETLLVVVLKRWLKPCVIY